MIGTRRTLYWTGVWAMMTVISAWLASQTQASWTFYIVVASFAILLLGILMGAIQRIVHKRRLKAIWVRFLIPKRNYPKKTIDGAPEDEQYPDRLTVGIGTYVLLLELESKVDLQFDPLSLMFEGSGENTPMLVRKANPFIVEQLGDGLFRNWWGHILPPPTIYPRRLPRGKALIDGNEVTTSGEWKGRIHVVVPVIGEGIIDKYLTFVVSTTQDDIPFQKTGGVAIITGESVANMGPIR